MEFTLQRVQDKAYNVTKLASGICQSKDEFTPQKLAQDLLESAPDAMVIVNGRGRIVLINRQTEKLFGYSRDELLGSRIERLIPSRFADRHEEHTRTFFNDSRLRPMGAGL